jgi:outer membrane lipase/esterase
MKLKVIGFTRATLCAGVIAAGMLLASCGGGQQVQTFHATRIIAMGDESSLINADQSKYTVNAILAGTTSTLDCASNPLWIQSVAAFYGLSFPQCPGDDANPVNVILATNGATVADLGTQIDTQLSNGGFAAGDMVTVLVGANDVIAQFQQYPAIGEPDLLANLNAAGVALADQVNRLADLGVKVIVSTIPDMGLTPFAGDRSPGSTDSNPGLLTRLSARFNDAMLAELTNDGHRIGLIQLDEFLDSTNLATSLNTGVFNNTTLASCSIPTPACTTNTLVDDAVNSTWLWADSLHLSPAGQASLGSLAVARAQNNPF